MITNSNVVVVSVTESCTHDVQYGGMCALCGAKIDEQDYTGFNDKDRAPIAMSHDNTGLKVSYDEAERIEKDISKQLLASRKLILVVDLDQTVIHVTVDPTVGDWKKDPNNPNHKSVKDVVAFSLEENAPPPNYKGQRRPPQLCWYYVKLRPGLQKFLEDVSKLYELHIYTMATRAYALAISKIIDPEGKYFGDRILSRDESGSLIQKDLKRLFPVDTSMVAIIDDRGDVWKWSANLIKVVPYDFFVGIGDINSSFLPQRVGTLTPTAKIEEVIEGNTLNPKLVNGATAGSSSNDVDEDVEASTVDQLVAISGGADNKELLAVQESRHSASIEAQQHDRPLAKLQHDLEVAETDADAELISESNIQEVHEHHRGVLQDNDTELCNLNVALVHIHREFYSAYDKMRKAPRYDGSIKRNKNGAPDMQVIMTRMKGKVFDGCVFLFSGVIPLGSSLDRADIVQWVRSFGAVVVGDFITTVTHVIATSGGTKKVYQASKYPHINVVYPAWIFKCIAGWARVPEDDYLLKPRIEAISTENNTSNETANESNTKNADDSNDMDLDEDFEDEDIDINELRYSEESENNTNFIDSLQNKPVDWNEVNKELDEFLDSESEDENENEDEEEGEGEEEDNKGNAITGDQINTNDRTIISSAVEQAEIESLKRKTGLNDDELSEPSSMAKKFKSKEEATDSLSQSDSNNENSDGSDYDSYDDDLLLEELEADLM
ncbi:hypothetical protein NADFUDRAFT_82224 [Nadsonia fulvescens var. elongata DSM 6958]|uniref:RNA polymerase II subunit A C-terminal domain phosphatase n=1 Tax=Nadsonia fulvescens var. elongata DSM 6958 TaxID=857566 RepID=A0A1E3PN79_9ASCO|nr:hypothetical protein NADFUDRAFT_82224 [Nadsonia fulvescens var. elongata DSM 6958]